MHRCIIELVKPLRPDWKSRRAICSCGWIGPERATLELAVDDALIHEGSDMHIVQKPRT